MRNRKVSVSLGATAALFLGVVVGCSSSPGPMGGQGGNGGGGEQSCGSDNADDLISDFKTDNGINPADGRSGGWYVYGDMLGAFDPPKNPDVTVPYPIDTLMGNSNCSGAGSFHVKASGFRMWGAAAATDFKPKVGAAKGLYDASKYRGISFWAKATKPIDFVQVKFPDVYSDTEADPTGIDPAASACALATGFPNNCSPYLVKLSPVGDAMYPNYATSKIDTIWKKFEVLFADAKQDQFNPGQKSPGDTLDVKHLVGFAIQVNANFGSAQPTANDFEFWIDDVRFMR